MRSPSLLTACLGILTSCLPLPAQTSAFTAEDMLALVGFAGNIAASPDGEHLAFALPDMSDEWNVMARRPRGYLQILPTMHGGKARVLTRGTRHSSHPAWSADSKKLAFIVQDENGGYLSVAELGVDRAQNLGSRFEGQAFLPPQWAGDWILLPMPFAPEPAPEVPRVQVLRSSDRTLPGDAFFQRRQRAGLNMVNSLSGEEKVLIEGPVNLRSIAVSPQGDQAILQIGGRSMLYDLHGEREPRSLTGRGLRWHPDGSGLIALNGGKITRAYSERTSYESDLAEVLYSGREIKPRSMLFSPDGKTIASLVEDRTQIDPEIEVAREGMYSIARPFHDLYLISLEDKTTRSLSAETSEQISDPVWQLDGKALYFRGVDQKSYGERLYRFELASSRLEILRGGAESYGNLMATAQGIAFTRQSATEPTDLWIHDSSTGKQEKVTDLNPQLSKFEFSAPELFHFASRQGDRLGALLYKPNNLKEGAKPPVLTNVYEKLTPGKNRFNARQQVFLSQGYAVLMPNVKIRVGQPGTSFVDCIVPAVEAVRDMGFSNGKFALWGGSWGGYATSFVITQTDIFDCAVSRATPPELFRNWASGRDRDSNNIERGQARMGGSPFEYQERYLSQSAFFHLDKVTTPVLIMHGAKDMTILYEEGAMMFYALRRLGKTAELVRYEEGDHSLSRHSRSDTLDVNARMLAWFGKYLRDE